MTGSSFDRSRAEAEGSKTRWARGAVLGATCALVIGVYACSAISGKWELWGRGAEDNYYNLLVRGFRDGQLNLKREPPPGLVKLADPYDPAANSSYRWILRQPLQDVSYYKGKLYLYFGVTPALLLFWPFAGLTGHYLLHKDAVEVLFSVGFLAGAGLLWAVWRRYFAGIRFGAVVAGTVALGLANFTPLVLQRSDVFEVAISCGYALTMLALVGIWRALHDESKRRGWWLAAASLAYGLALGARPSLLFGAVILLAPVAHAWRQKQRVWLLLTAATGPIALIGMGLMVYNVMRFDNPLEFGQRYQLTDVPQGTIQQFSPGYLWFNFRITFLEPARWGGLFPFVQDIAVPPLPKGGMVEHPFGVLTSIPLVWLALAVPLAWRSRLAEVRSALCWFLAALVALFVTCALTLGFHNSMCPRYELEFTHTLVFLAVIGIFALERTLAGRPVWGRVARWAWGSLLAFSVAFNLLAGVALHTESHNTVGRELFLAGQVDEAIPHFQKVLKIRPSDPDADYNLAIALGMKGQVDGAIAHYREALEKHPDYAATRLNLANALLAKGQVDEAIGYYRKALEIDPACVPAHNNLGNALFGRGQADEAITHYQDALKIDPQRPKIHNNLAIALRQRGRDDEAIVHLQTAVELDPDYADAHDNLANLLLELGRVREALAHYQTVLKLQPENARTLASLAWILATSPEASIRNGARSVELAQKASRLSGSNNPVTVGTLAAAYAEAGRFTEAVATAQNALQLAAAQTNATLRSMLREQLQLYQAGVPLRDAGQTNAALPARAP